MCWVGMFNFICFLLLFTSVCQARVKFIHIPKTGGTTIKVLLYEYFHRRYSHEHLDGVPHATAEIIAKELPDFDCELVDGHFPYWFMEEKEKEKENSFVFTVLRDPVERVLSHYRFYRQVYPDKNLSVYDIEPNWMCKMLCSDPHLEDSELLENAIENLEKLDFVIFMDNFEEDTINLLKMIGIDTENIEIPHINLTKKEEYDQETIEKIKNLHSLDIALYQYAKNNILLQR